MKENIKIALIGLIAVTLIINTFMKGDSNSSSSNQMESKVMTPSNTSVAAAPNSTDLDLTANEPIVENRPKTVMVFESYDHDFGLIEQDTENEHQFKFFNDGKEPLVITSAKGSCGCTVPEYPKGPIAPGESGVIKVVYSPGKQQNKQNKSVTITANTDPETTVLKLYANVNPSENPAQ